MTDALDQLGQLLSAARGAPDRHVRLAYLAEARSVSQRETERLRDLVRLLEILERQLLDEAA